MVKVSKITKPSKKIGKKRGKLIIIEGADGTGKATQAELLVEHLKENHVRVKYYDFPQYHNNFFGDMAARYLRGEYGSFLQSSPYLVSLPYALDRASVAEEMKSWLARGGWIVCNRYVSSHLAHQTAKMATSAERNAFIKWDQHLEYDVLSVPKEDRVICLNVPPSIASKLNLKKGLRSHLKKMRQDLAERDVQHQKKASDMYTLLSKRLKHWRLIKCVDRKGLLLPIATIHEKVVQSIQ
jgi:dTMP kinase